jgi:mono/diheme cytochrome c family protein
MRIGSAFLLVPLALAIAGAGPYRLPAAPDPVVPPDAEGQKFVENCAGCHSLDYVSTQPPAKGLAFWQAEVTKMTRIYGAPISEADGAAIARHLAATH